MTLGCARRLEPARAQTRAHAKLGTPETVVSNIFAMEWNPLNQPCVLGTARATMWTNVPARVDTMAQTAN